MTSTHYLPVCRCPLRSPPVAAHAPPPLAARAAHRRLPPRPSLLPPVPQPPERPIAPARVDHPLLPQAQRATFVRRHRAQVRRRSACIATGCAKAQYPQTHHRRDLAPAEAQAVAAITGRSSSPRRASTAAWRSIATNRARSSASPASTGVPAEIHRRDHRRGNQLRRATPATTACSMRCTRWPSCYPEARAVLPRRTGAAVRARPGRAHRRRHAQGSYAGAMGWGQFMPSSYRDFAADGDGDGKRDLIGDTRRRLRLDRQLLRRARLAARRPGRRRARSRDAGAQPLRARRSIRSIRWRRWRSAGYRAGSRAARSRPGATLLTLDGASRPGILVGLSATST